VEKGVFFSWLVKALTESISSRYRLISRPRIQLLDLQRQTLPSAMLVEHNVLFESQRTNRLRHKHYREMDSNRPSEMQ
jgi:hypothetical protein